jgi:hypothetical protein
MDKKRKQQMNPRDLPLSAAALQLMADANSQSARLQHEYIGTEHHVLRADVLVL